MYFYIVIEARTNLLVHTAQSVEEDTDVQVLVKSINLTISPENMEFVRITDLILTGGAVTEAYL